MQPKEISKFLSLVLRHQPQLIGIELDAQGWVDVNVLLQQLAAHQKVISKAKLEEVVRTNDKQRFAFNEDKTRIRANQGHSVTVDLGLAPQMPPAILYHGTAEKSLPSILEQGLLPQQRHHVHLSKDKTTAHKVGQRHGKPVILVVDSEKMIEDGFTFYLSENSVWLVATVPTQYIRREE